MKSRYLILKFTLVLFTFMIAGCYDELDSSSQAAVTLPYLNDTDFLGAKKVVNLGTGLSVEWDEANTLKNVRGYNIYRYELNKPKLIATVNRQVQSYIDGDVVSGSKYSYLVRAIDPSNNEDRNEAKKTGIFWEGLKSAISSSQSTIRVTFSSQLKGYRLQIYILGENKINKEEVALITTDEAFSLGYFDISKWRDGSSLKPGASYKVSAQISEISSPDIKDGNNLEYNVGTLSYGFHMISGQKQGWNNAATVRAFGVSPFSESLNTTSLAQTQTPSVAQVEIGFLPFSLPSGLESSMYRYKIIRAPEGILFDSSTLDKNCPSPFEPSLVANPSSLQACILEQNINPATGLSNGLIRYTDRTVWTQPTPPTTPAPAPKPPRYRYFLTLQHLYNANNTSTSFTEKIPETEFDKYSVLVPIPPAEMVLVNRETANFEFCLVQKQKASDPLKNNRCVNFEIGSDTFNSGSEKETLGLERNFYDFGYNLFVDRYPLSCKNTHFATNSSAPNVTTSFNILNTTPINVNDLNGSSTFQSNSTGTPTPANPVLYFMQNDTSTLGAFDQGGMTSCQIYFDGQWRQIADFLTVFNETTSVKLKEAFTQTLTNAPSLNGTPKFNYPHWTQELAQTACNSFNDNGYGKKRIPRLREFRAFTAPPFEIDMSGVNVKDFHAVDIKAKTKTILSTSPTWVPGSCVSTSVKTNLNTTIMGQLTPTNTYPSDNQIFTAANTNKIGVLSANDTLTFLLGSKNDSLCISKYGVNGVLETSNTHIGFSQNNAVTNLFAGDANENLSSSTRYAVSDLFFWTPSTTVPSLLKGLSSNLDQGNFDLSTSIELSNTGFELPISTTPALDRILTNSFDLNTRFIHTLGLPVISTNVNTLNLYTSSISSVQNYGAPLIFKRPNYNSTKTVVPKASHRYTTTFNDDINRVRCVLTAE